MQTAKDARKARRQRILERGSDRLAYITGDTSKQQSIRASPISPSHEASSSADSINTGGGNIRTFESHVATPEASDHAPEKVRDSQDSPMSGLQPAYLVAGLTAQQPVETTAGPASSSRSETTAEPVMASASLQRRAGKYSATCVKNVVWSIDVSEGVRAIAAAVVAVVVVSQAILSCCGDPWAGVLAVVLPRWPIGLVLLTDLTVIIGAYIIHAARGSSSNSERPGSTESDALLDGSTGTIISQALLVVAGRFEALLGMGLLCKKAAGAISLDCSIYIATLGCGLGISQYLFSRCTACF